MKGFNHSIGLGHQTAQFWCGMTLSGAVFVSGYI
jgi:hypothetical protein